MDVTKENFTEFLPLIKDSIEESHFIAIDTELTGLGTDGLYNAFDTMSERYLKIQQNCSKFLITQFGVSCFQYHPQQKKYTHKDFNFYIFPKPHIRQAPDPIFTCQTSSIHFLISNGFDFNKVFREGITYLNPSQEEKIKEHLNSKHIFENKSFSVEGKSASRTTSPKPVSVPNELKDFIQNISNQVNTFMSSDSEKTIELKPCNAFHRKFIYQTVRENYPSGIDIFLSKNELNEDFLTLVKATDKERFDELQNRQIADFNDLDAAVGFRKVLDLISQSKKLVIGHNMLLDILHTLNQFFSPLPESLEEFKQLVKCIFPHLLDTKTLASSEKMKNFIDSTSLPDVLTQLQGKALGLPIVEAADGFKGYNLNDKEKLHEAGYDAFITGLCYIGMKKKLGSIQLPAIDYVSSSSKLVSPFVNKIYMLQHYNISYLNLNESDAEPERENVFHVVFPKEWRTTDIKELFSPYGNIYINWLDSVSALVALKSSSQILNAKKALLKNVSSLYTVTTFNEFKKLSEKSVKEEKSSEHAIDPTNTNKRQLEKDCNIKTLTEKDVTETDVCTKVKKQKVLNKNSETPKICSTPKVFEDENVW